MSVATEILDGQTPLRERVTGAQSPMRFARERTDGLTEAQLVVPGMHCAGCLNKVERTLRKLPSVTEARANLTTKRVSVVWDPAKAGLDDLTDRLEAIAYHAAPFDPRLVASDEKTRENELLRAMAVSGFAAANIMLLSVAVWAGLFSDMEIETRALMHWVSALIALPAVAYAGRPFFRSGFGALGRGQLNMDVPISLAVILAAGASLFETVRGGELVYFDASVSLLFFLLIGRFLDVRMRGRASSAAQNLLGLRAVAATIIDRDGTRRTVPVDQVAVGDRVFVAAGMRVPVDGQIVDGRSEVDTSLVTGESVPSPVEVGSSVFAGTLNLSGPLTVTCTARDDESLLADIVRLMEAAEQGRAEFVRLADRLVRYYAPVVHVLAFGTFAGWLLIGVGWHPALMACIAVLIITCPCALGLAVPVVQVISTGRLLKQGVLVKSADALERLAEIDTVVFDKTGTLTLGEPVLANGKDIAAGDLALAAALCQTSHHPLSRAVSAVAQGASKPSITDVDEIPGCGLQGRLGDQTIRVGNKAWIAPDELGGDAAHGGPELWLRRGDEPPVRFTFTDRLREDAREIVSALLDTGLQVELLSGDRSSVTASAAGELGIAQWAAECRPQDKIARLEQLKQAGRRVLMVGDGLNDGPALSAAHVSMSPASASDVAQVAADFVFQGQKLAPVFDTILLARKSRRQILENFTLALGYNTIAVPLAIAGFVTPIIAAIAMSSSSLIVTLNSLRLAREAKSR